mgnify:CR=1 FL=1
MNELSGKQLKERVTALAKRKGYTMKDVALHVDLTPDGLRLALLKQTISYSKLQLIAKFFEIDVSTLIGKSENLKLKDEYKEKYYQLLEKHMHIVEEIQEAKNYKKGEYKSAKRHFIAMRTSGNVTYCQVLFAYRFRKDGKGYPLD